MKYEILESKVNPGCWYVDLVGEKRQTIALFFGDDRESNQRRANAYADWQNDVSSYV